MTRRQALMAVSAMLTSFAQQVKVSGQDFRNLPMVEILFNAQSGELRLSHDGQHATVTIKEIIKALNNG